MVIKCVKFKEKPSHLKITNRLIKDKQTSTIKDKEYNKINQINLGANS